ncbi:tyrosine-type recombinase/integrase [Salinicoccus sp. Marseille-QA3877]
MRTYKRTWKRKSKRGDNMITVTKWCYDITIGGERKRKCGFDDQTDAEDAAKELEASVRKGLDISKDSTFKDFYREWVTVYKKDKITKRAFQTYINALNQFMEFFGEDKKLATLDKMEYQKFINWYASTHTKESTRKVHNCLKAALSDAVYEGYIIKSPAYRIEYKAAVETKSDNLKYINRNDFIKLKEYLKSKTSKSALLLYILMVTGARFSEINDMQYIQLKHNGIDIPEGKTDSAKRFIHLPASDIKHIRHVLDQHNRKVVGNVFSISNNAAIKALDNALKKCNIEKRITPHGLRHSHCSVLLSEGVGIDYISKRLGHRSVKITLEVYSHLLEEQYEKDNNQTINFLDSI